MILKMRSRLYILKEVFSNPATLRSSLRDLRLSQNGQEAKFYLNEAVDWLCRAQDAVEGGGVSYGYDLKTGWLPPYPETTGYIIPTFLKCAHLCEANSDQERAENLRQRARRMADWLTTVQMESGAVQGGTIGREPMPTIFNTGQVLQGWCHAYREFKEDNYLGCLTRAAQWLVSVQDEDGCWRKFMSPLTLQTPATYNVRSASALLEAGLLLSDEQIRRAAIRNFDWALTQQRENGWFENNCLTNNAYPLTHTIGYTLEGFMDAACLLNDGRYLNAVLRASEHLKNQIMNDGFLSGRFDSNWETQLSWDCLTGSCQIALVWFRLADQTGRKEYAEAAKLLVKFVKSTQICKPFDSENVDTDPMRGGIKGSHPIWGGYDPFRYPNWAAKFFIDAMMMGGKSS
jgi:hypothetical protein